MFSPFCEILLGDLQPIAQLERLEIGGRHARDHGEGDRLLVVAAGHGRSPGGIARGAVLAPEVELVARSEHGIEDVVNPESSARNAGARALAGGGCAQIDRGQERRARDAQLRVRLLYAGDRAGQIIVVAFAPGRSVRRAGGSRTRATSQTSGQTPAACESGAFHSVGGGMFGLR